MELGEIPSLLCSQGKNGGAPPPMDPTLSLEVICDIAAYLQQPDLIKLARACRKWHDALIKRAYRNVVLNSTRSRQHKNIKAFHRTLRAHPDRAQWVERLELHALWDWNRNGIFVTSPLCKVLNLCLSAKEIDFSLTVDDFVNTFALKNHTLRLGASRVFEEGTQHYREQVLRAVLPELPKHHPEITELRLANMGLSFGDVSDKATHFPNVTDLWLANATLNLTALWLTNGTLSMSGAGRGYYHAFPNLKQVMESDKRDNGNTNEPPKTFRVYGIDQWISIHE
ncbi:uncharacterized protein EV422DRAFT_180680 [Fimicolochytrium jonesii]|uniref:uncharacterized protein n=1 Tax=Fimicolochytrium jonesii TaxID=1396493 RepID=UPI0022FEF3BA|nr:uncharacterized protein EV422DRAFT_180680 [Fimicolochytrium jonesii]KAI8818337.1 hypothetical protein EV422DRAFT_180680 [Fimicolochytrium jonesii]